jgi:hypothetical protein
MLWIKNSNNELVNCAKIVGFQQSELGHSYGDKAIIALVDVGKDRPIFLPIALYATKAEAEAKYDGLCAQLEALQSGVIDINQI